MSFESAIATKKKREIPHKLLDEIALAMPLLIITGFAVAICQFGYQIYSYLEMGFWPNMSALASLRSQPSFKWLFFPDCWFGLNKILTAVLDFFSPGMLLGLSALIALPFIESIKEGMKSNDPL